MRLLDISLQMVGGVLLIWLAAAILRRRLHREYPFFFLYVVFTALATGIRLSVSSSREAYFFVYWGSEAFFAVLALLALHEVFYDVFYSFYAFQWFRPIFPGVVTVIAFFSIRHGMLKPPPQATAMTAVILSVGKAVDYVQAVLFLIFLLLVVVLHVRWRRYPYDIALGFAVSTLGDWLGFVLSSGFRTKYTDVIQYASPVAYILATLIWLRSFSGRVELEPKLKWREDITPEQLLAEVKEYIRIMRKVLGKRNGF